MTERKCTRITDARVWNSVREKDKENERERYGRRMLQDIRAEAGYKKQDSSRRPSGSERERDDWEKESTSWTRREDEKEGSRNVGGNWREENAVGCEGERREDEGVERDSAVISKREEACGCDVRRPC